MNQVEKLLDFLSALSSRLIGLPLSADIKNLILLMLGVIALVSACLTVYTVSSWVYRQYKIKKNPDWLSRKDKDIARIVNVLKKIGKGSPSQLRMNIQIPAPSAILRRRYQPISNI